MLFVCCVAFDKTEKGPIRYIKKREREKKEEEKKGGERKESEQMVTLAVNEKITLFDQGLRSSLPHVNYRNAYQ